MLQDLQAEVPDDGRLRLLRQLQPAGHADGALLLELLAELGEGGPGHVHAVTQRGRRWQPHPWRSTPEHTRQLHDGSQHLPGPTRHALARPRAVRTGHPRGRRPAPSLPPRPGGTLRASRRYRCVDAGSMMTVTAFTSCSQRPLTCSADMAAAAGARHRPPTRGTSGAAGTQLRACALGGTGTRGERGRRAPSRRGHAHAPPHPGELRLPACPTRKVRVPQSGGPRRSSPPHRAGGYSIIHSVGREPVAGCRGAGSAWWPW